MQPMPPFRTLLSGLRGFHTTAAASGKAPPQPLTHLDQSHRACMVDVGGKPSTSRTARASASIQLGVDVYSSVEASLSSSGGSAKGDVLTIAQLAGIQAAKQTATLIPLCHPLMLSHISVKARLSPPDAILIDAVASTDGQTGVEMEAMTAASVAALTVYDMVKGVGKGVSITHVQLEEKQGGKSGDYIRQPEQ